MNMFFFIPAKSESLFVYFMLESILLFINIPIFIGSVAFTASVRIHPNLKIYTLVLLVQFFPFLFSRLVIISYEIKLVDTFVPIRSCNSTGLLSTVIVSCTSFENNLILVVASWFRCHYLALILTSIFWYGVERTWATFYVRDYERKPRLWIAIVHSFQSTGTSMFCAAIYTLDLFSWYPMAAAGVGSAVVGFTLFVYSYKKSVRIMDDFNANGSTGDLTYTLSLRFQLEENLWCSKQMKNAYLGLGFFNMYTFLVFLLATLEPSNEYFGRETTQIIDCIYNLLMTLNGPCIFVCAVLKNEYFTGVFKKVLFPKKTVAEQPVDETQVYFARLQAQWEMPEEKHPLARKSKMSRRIAGV